MGNKELRNLIIGITIGLAVGISLLVLVGRYGGKELKATIAKQELDLTDQAKKIEKLRNEKKEAQALLRQAAGEAGAQSAKMVELRKELAATNEKVVTLEARCRELMGRAATAEQEKSPDTKKAKSPVEEELARLQKEAMERYGHIQVIGEPLKKETVQELELDETATARINEMLKDEGERATRAIADFFRDNIPDPPENLAELSAQDLIWKMLPHIAKDLARMSALPPQEYLKLYKHETDVLDYIPRDSNLMRLGYALHQVRQETCRQVERELPHGKAEVFGRKFLPPDDFVFPGNMNFLFGKIDWEKERE